jgi:quercetin dioxygenase-like cupin family protein
MTRGASDLPDFVRDALDADAVHGAELAEALALLARDLPPISSDARRLLSEVERLPLRYSPFFDALGALWDLSERDVVRTLERAGDPARWKRAALPGVRSIEVAPGPRLQGANVALTRFRPGFRFPRHYHDGPEALLVLEGRYRDESGRSVGPGELHAMPAGTEHTVEVDRSEPCVVATVHFGVHFTGPILRILARLFG